MIIKCKLCDSPVRTEFSYELMEDRFCHDCFGEELMGLLLKQGRIAVTLDKKPYKQGYLVRVLEFNIK